MSKQLKSIKDWNNERWPYAPTSVEGNGIACPGCGEEMSDEDPYTVLQNRTPPQKQVVCRKCLYQATVLA